MADFDISEIEDFIQRRVWKQIVEDALSRALLLSEDNDMIDPMEKPNEISRNQGEIKALKWVVDLPRIIKEDVEQSKREEKNNARTDGE